MVHQGLVGLLVVARSGGTQVVLTALDSVRQLVTFAFESDQLLHAI